MNIDIVIAFVEGKLKDGCKRFDADIMQRVLDVYHGLADSFAVMTADRDRWLEVAADYKGNYVSVMSEECAADEQHCTCVPVLRAEVERLNTRLAEVSKERDVENKWAKKHQARAVALNGEVERLQAKNDMLVEKLNDWNESYNAIIEDKTCLDEVHCTCVPALRQELASVKGDFQSCHVSFGTQMDINKDLTAKVERLQKLLDELQDAEAHYRLMHDTSPVKLDIGRAWDFMRKAGNHARAELKAKP